jgi:hypothetical protein
MKKALSFNRADEIIREYCKSNGTGNNRSVTKGAIKEFNRCVDVWVNTFAKHLEEYMQSKDREGQSKRRISDDYVQSAFADFILGVLEYENRR